MLSALSVIVLGDSCARPLHVSTLSFVIVSWLEVVFFVVFPGESNVRGCWVEGFGACTASVGHGMLALSF